MNGKPKTLTNLPTLTPPRLKNRADSLSGFFVQFVDFEEAITEGQTLEEAGFNAAEVLSGVLALETSWAAVQRLEDPHHWPSLKQLDRAARALGKRLVLNME